MSGSIVKPYANASTENWRRYAALRGYKFEVSTSSKEQCGEELFGKLQDSAQDKAPIWGKICLLQNLLLEAPARGLASKPSYVLVIDADTYVQQPDFSIMDSLVTGLLNKHRKASGLMFEDRAFRDDYPGCWGQQGGKNGVCRPNSFLMLFRRGSASNRFVKQWLDDAVGACANEASLHPTDQLVLWKCTIPSQEPGTLYVHNGLDTFFTLDIGNTEPPLVHFTMMKEGSLAPVREAIGQVPMSPSIEIDGS